MSCTQGLLTKLNYCATLRLLHFMCKFRTLHSTFILHFIIVHFDIHINQRGSWHNYSRWELVCTTIVQWNQNAQVLHRNISCGKKYAQLFQMVTSMCNYSRLRLVCTVAPDQDLYAQQFQTGMSMHSNSTLGFICTTFPDWDLYVQLFRLGLVCATIPDWYLYVQQFQIGTCICNYSRFLLVWVAVLDLDWYAQLFLIGTAICASILPDGNQST